MTSAHAATLSLLFSLRVAAEALRSWPLLHVISERQWCAHKVVVYGCHPVRLASMPAAAWRPSAPLT